MSAEFDEGTRDAGRKLAPVRVGSVAYLNAAPLTLGVENQVVFAPPSSLAELLRAKALDAALVSVVEVLRDGGYDVLDGVSIASRGPVRSVLLAHRVPLEAIREVFCDTASLTSVSLLRVLLAERGLQPRLTPLPEYATAPDRDAVLLIGDPALAFLAEPRGHRIWDLGEAWRRLTGLPFVYAVWALRRGVTTPEWRRCLRSVCEQGLTRREEIVARCAPAERDALRRYLTENIRYELGAEEKAGVARFIELLEHHTGASLHRVNYLR
ncbi:MAG: menaquinone biosynthesis protein [Verrucomicrobiae bacterium]|nr:menaquinone biosynthesis protein [Verrucomicrobiae bacterium]MCP5523076.1 menaquinone biosynthesis protein [Verrucomicrobiales bacterium]